MDLLQQITAAGIIGAGGAGFPTHVKLAKPAEILIMNAAECEPLLRVDQQLMDLHADEILTAFESLRGLLQAKEAVIGVKSKHAALISKLTERIHALGFGQMRIHELPDAYPVGDEQILLHEVTGRVVPEVGLPADVGCVVVNSETCLNVYHAMQGEPVTETYISVVGDVPHRATYAVPVGTPIKEVLALSGVDDLEHYAVIDGGPMMGNVTTMLNAGVTKKQKGFILLKKDHPLIPRKTPTFKQASRVNRGACEQCRLCTDLCPRYLLGLGPQPHKVMRAMTYGSDNLEDAKPATLCCQCGVCELFACPAGLFPKTANMIYKAKLAESGFRYQREKDTFTPRPQRKWRYVPSKRLMARLRIDDFDRPAPMEIFPVQPTEVKISLRQHIGAPAEAVVAVGDHVTKGQLIGKIPEGALAANVHASMAGTVAEVTNAAITIRR